MIDIFGKIQHRECEWSDIVDHIFYIMPRYGEDLLEVFKSFEMKFSVPSIVTIATSILSQLEKIHEHGYCFNDLKLDNLVVGFEQNPLRIE